jgi:hypothetical protein
MQIQLQIINDKIKVTSPYHPELVSRARRLRGEWKHGAWWFDDSILDYVRELMLKCYGVTGEISYDVCTLLVKDFTVSELQGPVFLFGRTIAKAYSRDSRCDLGDDIFLIDGNVSSGGSMKNWRTCVTSATFEIKNVPVPRAQMHDVQRAIQEGWCEIKYSTKKRSLDVVLEEISLFETRLQELKKELESL